MKSPVVPEGSVTFADYFKLNAYIEDVLAVFGYSYHAELCELPRKEVDQARLVEIKSHLGMVLPTSA